MIKTIVSCSGKFHAFALAEQLHKRGALTGLYTTYAWQKNALMRRFAGRVDKENISAEYIRTNIPLAVLLKTRRYNFASNDLFDRWVAISIATRRDYDIFIGWSGMSLRALNASKRQGKITMLERGSSHILHQNSILKEEYSRFGIDFSIDNRVIEKELKEYESCHYISIPSSFVKKSFIEQGVSPEKLVVNPYGASGYFLYQNERTERPFRVLYLGSLTIQKGLIYLFEALSQLNISQKQYEVWFIGHVAEEMKDTIKKYNQYNWHFHGHVPHYELPELINQCDIGVLPSLQDGFGMVIPQMLGCGVPVIASTNTGGADIIREGETGFIVPVRSTEAIAEKIMFLYKNPECLAAMKAAAAASVRNGFTWDDYGERYVSFLNKLA